MQSLQKGLCCTFVLLFFYLSACSERETPAPVYELNWNPHAKTQQTHQVHKGETLYAIAFRYDRDYRELAKINHLNSPYTLHIGQKIALAPSPNTKQGATAVQVKKQEQRTLTKHSRNIAKAATSKWVWPARGKVVNQFSPKLGKKGINIAGKKGDKIYAASTGVVAYAGDGLPGYGNLIILKHNQQYLTAYGNNAKILVKEGQHVKTGQVIATMGMVDRKYPGLHFEIRKRGQPVSPTRYLQKG